MPGHVEALPDGLLVDLLDPLVHLPEVHGVEGVRELVDDDGLEDAVVDGIVASTLQSRLRACENGTPRALSKGRRRSRRLKFKAQRLAL